jgi:triacylglycerol lipase
MWSGRSLGKAASCAFVLALAATVSACAASDVDAAGSSTSALETEAPYPIVLAHGFFGFKDFAGLDFLTYFYGVQADLNAHGETRVFTPAVDPFNDSTTRGAQLEAKILEILQQTGAKKVNIIGHSQGGLDARYVAHHRPDIVASVTTVATPHAGSHLADVVLDVTSVPILGDLAGEAVDALVRLLGAPLWDQVGNETSVTKAIRQVSSDGMDDFNRRYPDGAGVRYFSIAGRTAEDDGGRDCRVSGISAPPAFVARTSRMLDPTDILLKVPETVTSGWPFDDVPNDGFVRVDEARWGTFLGCVPADHLDEVGQLLGDGPGGDNDWDYLGFYRDLVGYLRTQGL